MGQSGWLEVHVRSDSASVSFSVERLRHVKLCVRMFWGLVITFSLDSYVGIMECTQLLGCECPAFLWTWETMSFVCSVLSLFSNCVSFL